MHNAPTVAQNTMVSVARKVEDNILRVMATPVIAPQHATPPNPVTNPLYALLKVLSALVIKQMHMLSGKLKDTKAMA